MDFDISSFSELITNKLSGWLKALIKILPNLVLAVIVVVIGFFLAKWVRKMAQRLIRKVSHNITLNNLFASIIYFIFIGVVLFTALTILNLDKTVSAALAGAGIVGLALAFAFQDIASNFMSGIFISFRKPIKVGEIVSVKDYMGKVAEVNLRDTVIHTFAGQTVIIPNKEVFQNPIENYSHLGKRRFDLSVGVSYGDDLEKVKQITMDAVKDIKELSQKKGDETTMFFEEFGDSSINFTIRMWISNPEQITYKKVGSDAIMKIKKAYDDNDIMIPFPIRTLDFGIKGGEKLSEMDVNIADRRSANKNESSSTQE